ncbi:MAG: YqeG family HAD IIIA-type phosphatase [Acutalibacteraceae bacterium]|nr:YqeG family HAD IIIA-type phosphatase [Acutalibacteraceae bacterium]
MKTLFFNTLLDIEVSVLTDMNIKCVLLDIDNTIKPYGAKEIDNDCKNWIDTVKESGIKVILCSNNYKHNVEPIANQANCDFIPFCLKPSPFGYFRAYLKSETRLKNIIVIGDQFFTDIMGGKIMLMNTFLVEPISAETEGRTVKIRRMLTSYFTNRIKSRKNPYIKGRSKNE